MCRDVEFDVSANKNLNAQATAYRSLVIDTTQSSFIETTPKGSNLGRANRERFFEDPEGVQPRRKSASKQFNRKLSAISICQFNQFKTFFDGNKKEKNVQFMVKTSLPSLPKIFCLQKQLYGRDLFTDPYSDSVRGKISDGFAGYFMGRSPSKIYNRDRTKPWT